MQPANYGRAGICSLHVGAKVLFVTNPLQAFQILGVFGQSFLGLSWHAPCKRTPQVNAISA